MNRLLAVLLLAAAPGLPTWAAPPDLGIPPEVVASGEFVTLTPTGTAKSVLYVSLDGVSALPPELLKDPRTFAFFTRGLPAGRYRFVAVGTLNDEQARQGFVVVVGDAPAPVPPGPSPAPPGPTPTPPGPTPPAPIPGDGLRVLFVTETADVSKLPRSQINVLTATSIREYLNAKCAKDETGKPAYRIWDKDVPLSAAPPSWQAAMKRPRTSYPWLIISNPAKGSYEGPLPATVNETLDLIKKHGD